jgi:hypothetical protein
MSWRVRPTASFKTNPARCYHFQNPLRVDKLVDRMWWLIGPYFESLGCFPEQAFKMGGWELRYCDSCLPAEDCQSSARQKGRLE